MVAYANAKTHNKLIKSPVKKSTKAVLLSALVFPGSGHLYLKKYISGVLLAGISFAAIYYVLTKSMEQAFAISDKILSGETQLDIQAITEQVAQQSGGADAQLLNVATIVICLCWLIGIIDAYRVGRICDKKDAPTLNR